MDKNLFFYELEGRGYTFQNKNWDEAKHGFEDDMLNMAWEMWSSGQVAKAQAVPEKDAVIKKLSDQLYAQEMKASAARVLCETACELLDDYAHQDAMVILNDLEQAMKEPTND